jgi:hypothetical protein
VGCDDRRGGARQWAATIAEAAAQGALTRGRIERAKRRTTDQRTPHQASTSIQHHNRFMYDFNTHVRGRHQLERVDSDAKSMLRLEPSAQSIEPASATSACMLERTLQESRLRGDARLAYERLMPEVAFAAAPQGHHVRAKERESDRRAQNYSTCAAVVLFAHVQLA